MKAVRLSLAAACFSGFLGFQPAQAFSGGDFPACDEPQVLTYIQKRFRWTDEKLLKRGLSIESITNAHTNKARPANGEEWPVARLYCHGTAHMNDGRRRTIWWLIEEGWGFASLRDNLEFCIDGLDPLRVHGAWCRSVR